MRLEEQVKAIEKQITFLENNKARFTGGKTDKEVALNTTIEALSNAKEVLGTLHTLRDNLLDCFESMDKVNKSLEELTRHLIM